MSLAETIERVLDAAADRFKEDNDHPLFKPYVDFCRERYRYWRAETDFCAAAKKARTETIQRIIDEYPK